MKNTWHTIGVAPGKTVTVADLLNGYTESVYAPSRVVRRGRRDFVIPWLGSLVLAKWDGCDPHIWHDIRGVVGVSAILGGWPPWVVDENDVIRFRNRVEELNSIGLVDKMPAPCAVGDIIRFSYLSFYRIISRCLWVGFGVVGARVRMLGHDHILQVPWEFIERYDDQMANAPQYGRKRHFAAKRYLQLQ